VKVILVRPAYDRETNAMSVWAERVKFELDLEPEEDLRGPSANEQELRKALQRHATASLIAYYGHGEPEFLPGKWNGDLTSPLIHIRAPGVLPEELRGRKLYAVACKSARDLGPALADVGCAFVGYVEDFSFALEFEKEFGDVVNRSLLAWTREEKSSEEIGDELQEAWYGLADLLSSDAGQRKDLWQAATMAMINGRHVRSF
jgi:hypothetical protein